MVMHDPSVPEFRLSILFLEAWEDDKLLTIHMRGDDAGKHLRQG